MSKHSFVFLLTLLAVFSLLTTRFSFASSQATEYLCELGITFNNLGKLLQFYGYNNQLLQADLKTLFTNVNLGDSPMNMLLRKE